MKHRLEVIVIVYPSPKMALAELWIDFFSPFFTLWICICLIVHFIGSTTFSNVPSISSSILKLRAGVQGSTRLMASIPPKRSTMDLGALQARIRKMASRFNEVDHRHGACETASNTVKPASLALAIRLYTRISLRRCFVRPASRYSIMQNSRGILLLLLRKQLSSRTMNPIIPASSLSTRLFKLLVHFVCVF